MTGGDLLPGLRAAVRHFEARQFSDTAEVLEGLADHGGPLGEGLLLAARGLMLEAEGRPDEAAPLMLGALAQDSPHPALLAELSAYFGRSGRPSEAHYAFLMHDLAAPRVSTSVAARDMSLRERARYAPWLMRALVAQGRQLTYRFAPFKAALVGRLGPEGAAVTLAAMSGAQSPRVATRRPIVSLIDHANRYGHEYEEVIPAGPAPSMATQVFGRLQPEAPPTRRARALFACVLDDIVVNANSNVLLAGEGALLDVQGDELTRRPHDLGVDPVVVTGTSDEVLVLSPRDDDALRRIPEAIWLNGVHSWAFGHWIMEFLPKVWALVDRPGFRHVPILVDEGMPSQHLEAVRLFAGEDHPVIILARDDSVRVARLWVASALVYLSVGPLPGGGDRIRNGLDAGGFRALLDRIGPVLESVDMTGTPARIYLVRKPSQHRRLRNAPEIESRLDERGFEPFDFGDLSFREQLAIIRGAEHVVGAGGSAPLMTIFGRPGLRIGVLMPPYLNDVGWLTQASRALGQELTILVGDVVNQHGMYRWLSDYEVDPAQVVAYLDGTAWKPPPAPDG